MGGFAFLMTVALESLVLLVGAFFLGRWLDKSYPSNASWLYLTILVAFVLIARSVYVTYRRLDSGGQ